MVDDRNGSMTTEKEATVQDSTDDTVAAVPQDSVPSSATEEPPEPKAPLHADPAPPVESTVVSTTRPGTEGGKTQALQTESTPTEEKDKMESVKEEVKILAPEKEEVKEIQ